MAGSSHSSHKLDRRVKYRDPVASRKHGEYVEDIKIACHKWLLDHCPGYQEEYAALVGQRAERMTNGN